MDEHSEVVLPCVCSITSLRRKKVTESFRVSHDCIIVDDINWTSYDCIPFKGSLGFPYGV